MPMDLAFWLLLFAGIGTVFLAGYFLGWQHGFGKKL